MFRHTLLRLMSSILLLVTVPATAKQYLTVEQAQHVLFSEKAQFISQPVHLDAKQKDRVEDYYDVRMRTEEQPVWRVGRDAHGLVHGGRGVW